MKKEQLELVRGSGNIYRDFSRVRNADFRRISVERLMAMINGLGSRVEVKVKVRRGESAGHAAIA